MLLSALENANDHGSIRNGFFNFRPKPFALRWLNVTATTFSSFYASVTEVTV